MFKSKVTKCQVIMCHMSGSKVAVLRYMFHVLCYLWSGISMPLRQYIPGVQTGAISLGTMFKVSSALLLYFRFQVQWTAFHGTRFDKGYGKYPLADRSQCNY